MRWIVLISCLQLPGTIYAQNPRVDLYGDPLPQGAVARLGTVRLCSSEISSDQLVAFDSSGLRLATAYHGFLSVWDRQGRERFSVDCSPNDFGGICFGPGGKTIVGLLTHGVMACWDIGDRRKRYEIKTRLQTPSDVGDTPYFALSPQFHCFSPGGRFLAVQTSVKKPWSSFDVYDLTQGKRAYQAVSSPLRYALGFTEDGNALIGYVPAKKVTLGVWEFQKQKLRQKYVLPDGEYCWSMASKGEWLALARFPILVVINTRTGSMKRSRLWTSREDPPFHCRVGFADGGKTVVVAHLSTVRFFETGTLHCYRSLIGSNWSMAYGAISSKGNRLVANNSEGGRSRLYDLKSGKQIFDYPTHTSSLIGGGFANNGKEVVTWSSDGTVRFWDWKGKPLGKWHVPVRTAQVTSDGSHLAVLGNDVTVRQLQSGRIARRISLARKNRSELLALGSRSVAIAEGRSVRILGLLNGKERARLSLPDLPKGYQYGLCARGMFSQGERYFLGLWLKRDTRDFARETCSLVLWDVPQQKVIRSSDREPLPFVRLRHLFCLGANGTYSLGDWQDRNRFFLGNARGAQLFPVSAPDLESIAFSHCSKLFAVLGLSTEGSSLTLFETASRQPIARFTSKDHRGRELCFSPDGRCILSTGWSGTALLWDVLRLPSAEPKKLSRERFAALWEQMASLDAKKAFVAQQQLLASPVGTAKLLLKRLLPLTKPLDREQLQQWLVGLNSPRFAQRQQAMLSVKRFGRRAVPFLENLIKGKMPLEVRRRGQRLLEEMEDMSQSGNDLRIERAIFVLDHLGKNAIGVLRELAKGSDDSPVTVQARELLARKDMRKRGQRSER